MENQPKRKFKKKMYNITPTGVCITPKRISKVSAGYVLALPEDVTIDGHGRTAVSLNFILQLPIGVVAEVLPLPHLSQTGMHGYGSKKVRAKKFGIKYQKTFTGRQYFNADVIPTLVDAESSDVDVNIIIKNNDEQFMLRRGTKIARLVFHAVQAPFVAKEVEQELEHHDDEDNDTPV